MQMFAKKRIEILIKGALLKRLTEELERTGVSGYSVAPLTLSPPTTSSPCSRCAIVPALNPQIA